MKRILVIIILFILLWETKQRGIFHRNILQPSVNITKTILTENTPTPTYFQPEIPTENNLMAYPPPEPTLNGYPIFPTTTNEPTVTPTETYVTRTSGPTKTFTPTP